MKWTPSAAAIFSIGILHALFMVGELFPWKRPGIMALVVKKWHIPLDLSPAQVHFVSNVVHNAGVYNGIVAAGLFASVLGGPAAFPVQVALLAGGIVAGIVGAFTLTPQTIAQAIFGLIALVVVVWSRS